MEQSGAAVVFVKFVILRFEGFHFYTKKRPRYQRSLKHTNLHFIHHVPLLREKWNPVTSRVPNIY